MSRTLAVVLGLALLAGSVSPVCSQEQAVEVQDEGVRVRFSDTDLRFAIQAIGRLLPKPVLVENLGELRLELFETPRPVPTERLPEILRGLAESQGLVFEEDSTFYRIRRPAQEERGAVVAQPRGQPEVSREQDREPVLLFTVRLRHARAADVAATLNQLYGVGGGVAYRPGLSTGTLSDELRGSRIPPPGTVPGEPAVPPPEEGATLTGRVTIVPDELTNSLLIRATQEDYEVLTEGIQELDVRPLQVLIEVMAVEARKDRQFSLGFNLEVPPQDFGVGTVEGSLVSAGLGDLVVQVMNLGKEKINAVLSAATSRGEVEIVSRPVLLASNNTEARLLVGTQQPFVQVSRSLPTESAQRDQVIQYRDVGTKLTVLPTINQDGYVSLLIQQEISQATGETQFSAPVISSRETLTQVLVEDGQTIVIGGLRDRVQDRIRTGIPVLSDIPVLGGLFGGTKTRTTETELFLFITPTILDSDEDAREVTEDKVPARIRTELLPDVFLPDSLAPLKDTTPTPSPQR